MRFRMKSGDFREYRGHVFTFDRPTTVLDRGSIKALTAHPDFEIVADVAPAIRRPTLHVPRRKTTPKDNRL